MKFFSKPIKFLGEVKQELSKVSWSSRQEVIGSTIVVVTITSIMTVFIGIIDILLSKGLSIIFK